METIKELLALAGFGPENIQALLWISLASVFVPQVIKRSLPKVHPELLSVLAGASAGAVFSGDPAKGAVLGVIVAAFWTAAYKPVMRLVYKKWPELEEKMSAKPQKVVQTPEGLEVRDEDEVSGEDEHTILHVDAPTVPKEGATVPKKGMKPEPSNE